MLLPQMVAKLSTVPRQRLVPTTLQPATSSERRVVIDSNQAAEGTVAERSYSQTDKRIQHRIEVMTAKTRLRRRAVPPAL